MKKIISIGLVLLLLLSLAACGGGGTDANNADQGGANDAATEDTAATEDGDVTGDIAATGVAAEAEAATWWDGPWYGWYNVYDAFGPHYEHMDSLAFDCYAYVEMNEDNTGVLYLWDWYEELGTIEFELDLSADAPMGVLVALGGDLFFEDIESGEWSIDPTEWSIDPAEEGNENHIYLYEDARLSGDEYMWFELNLKPWGDLWENVPTTDLLPPHFNDWYVERGYCEYPSMLDALTNTFVEGEPYFVHPDLPQRAYDQ